MCSDAHVTVQKAKVDSYLSDKRVNLLQSKVQIVDKKMLKFGRNVACYC